MSTQNTQENLLDQKTETVTLAQFRQNVKTFISQAGHSVISTTTSDPKKTISFNCKTESGANLLLQDLQSQYPFVIKSGLKCVTVGQYGMPVAKNYDKKPNVDVPENGPPENDLPVNANKFTGKRTLGFIRKKLMNS